MIEYIEVTADDIAQANALAHEVLGRSLDELPPQTRRLLGALCALVAERMQRQSFAAAAGYLTSLPLRSLNRSVIVRTASRDGRTPLSYRLRLPADTGQPIAIPERGFGGCRTQTTGPTRSSPVAG